MIKGAIGIVGLAVVAWTVGCGTHSGIGNLGTGGTGGEGPGSGGTGVGTGGGDQGDGSIITGSGGDLGIGGAFVEGAGGMLGIGGQVIIGTGGASSIGGANGSSYCPGGAAGASAIAPKTLAFRAPVDYPTGAGAIAVAAADLNGDGKVDLVLLDQTSGVRIMTNNGDGTFAGPVDHSLGAPPFAMALGDLNGDGTIDIAAVTSAGIAILRNQGNAAFAPPVTYVIGINSIMLALGDLNNDGLLDIAVADEGATSGAGDLGVLLNAGGATFSAQNFGMINQPQSIAIGDLNEDCQMDVAIADADGVSLLSTAHGIGGQYVQSHVAIGTSGQSVAIADVNGDGKPDLVEGDRYQKVGYVLLNQGRGVLTAPVRYPFADSPDASVSAGSTVSNIAVIDLNGDSRPDLVGITGESLGVFSNQGAGSFATPVAFPMTPYPASLAHGDFNGDGLEDIAVVSNNSGQFVPASNLRVLINGSH